MYLAIVPLILLIFLFTGRYYFFIRDIKSKDIVFINYKEKRLKVLISINVAIILLAIIVWMIYGNGVLFKIFKLEVNLSQVLILFMISATNLTKPFINDFYIKDDMILFPLQYRIEFKSIIDIVVLKKKKEYTLIKITVNNGYSKKYKTYKIKVYNENLDLLSKELSKLA